MPASRFERIRNSPAIYPGVADTLGASFPWHTHAASARSSQALCLSAWVPLSETEARHAVIERLLESAWTAAAEAGDAMTHDEGADAKGGKATGGLSAAVPPRDDRRWRVSVEVARPAVLGEQRGGRPSTIDVLLEADDVVVCVESKYLSDAAQGFGRCSQFPGSCRGFYGPGSDLATASPAPCRLAAPSGGWSARRYWELAAPLFTPEALAYRDEPGNCPLNRFYQLARNLLFAAECARLGGKPHFAALCLVPAATAERVERQTLEMRCDVLRPEHAGRVATLHYERLAVLMTTCGDEATAAAGRFVAARLPSPPAGQPRRETVRELRRRAEAERRARRKARR